MDETLKLLIDLCAVIDRSTSAEDMRACPELREVLEAAESHVMERLAACSFGDAIETVRLGRLRELSHGFLNAEGRLVVGFLWTAEDLAEYTDDEISLLAAWVQHPTSRSLTPGLAARVDAMLRHILSRRPRRQEKSPGALQREFRIATVDYARRVLSTTPIAPDLLNVLHQIIPGEESLQVWLVSNSGWLGGLRPIDVLDEPKRIVEAARRTMEDLAI